MSDWFGASPIFFGVDIFCIGWHIFFQFFLDGLVGLSIVILGDEVWGFRWKICIGDIDDEMAFLMLRYQFSLFLLPFAPQHLS